MNRVIKFRGKRIDNGEWIYGHYFISPLTDENSGTSPDKGWFFLSDGVKRHCIERDGVVFVIDPETLSQSTGLHDKSGKEIYEGDIVRSNPDGVIDRNCKVVFPFYLQVKNKLSGSYSFCSWNLSNKDEIIGNIFENPELLEAAK